MSNLKLGVEVINAHNLIPKDGQGSSSAFVELHFDHQKLRTTIKEKDLDPVWNEIFYFNVFEPKDLPNQMLEAQVYNSSKSFLYKNSLGKVCIAGTSFVPYSDAVVLHYPLDKGCMLLPARGELGLKVFLTDDPSFWSSKSLPPVQSSLIAGPYISQVQHHAQEIAEQVQDSVANGEKASRHRTRHRPSKNHGHEKQDNSSSDAFQQSTQHGVGERRTPSQGFDYSIKETSPVLGGGQVAGGKFIRSTNKPTGTHDLVQTMQFLFVRVAKARNLPSRDVTGSLDPYVIVRVGHYKGITQHFEKNKSPEWNVVFAFAKERMKSSVLDVVVKDKDPMKDDDFVGIIHFDLHDIPTRVPPDSPLALKWHHLEDKQGEKKEGELMLAVWFGTQADDSYSEACHTDTSSTLNHVSIPSSIIRSKVYHLPALWYIRVNVIEARFLVISEKNTQPVDIYVKAHLGNQILKTRSVQVQTADAFWNEDFMFVAAAPFGDHLILSVEECSSSNKDEALGEVFVPFRTIEKRTDDRVIHSQWFDLQKPSSTDSGMTKKDNFAGRLRVRVCLDGGYHVFHESTHYSSDLRPTAEQLWKPPIGLLELGILDASGLWPVKSRDGKRTSDTYCVTKYGRKWNRTRTIIDSLNPKYNEQYSWEVFDLATVLTVAVFDNAQLGDQNGIDRSKDAKMGKVQIRISTLETGHIYTHLYPLIVLESSGIRKMGDLHLAIRFSCTSMMNMMFQYSRPVLPKMHYVKPLGIGQADMARRQAVNILAARLSQAAPPLKKDVVEYMCTDIDHSHLWSMRRSKANFFRLMATLNGVLTLGKWLREVCMWRNPITTVLVHVLFVILVCFSNLIIPTMFLYVFVSGVCNYGQRPTYPPHINTKLSFADSVHPDELDEEFDTFPTSQSSEVLKMRYDRLRCIAGRVQTVVGDLATQVERMQAVLSWRDPRTTLIFMMFCFLALITFYAVPLEVLVVMAGFYAMRHPRFRRRLPPAALNFFRRLPAKTDSML